MKAKVIKRFKDKHTGDLYVPGGLFEGETARIEYLKERGYVDIAYTKKELQTLLDKQGIEYSNKLKKDELISLLGGD